MKTLYKNCILIEKGNSFNNKKVDILVENQYIVKIDSSIDFKADRVVDMHNSFCSAGWIDMHVHCFLNKTDLGVEADEIGYKTGVVCIVDAGSSGEKNIEEFYEQLKQNKTIVKAWINIASTGLINRYELKDLSNISVENTIQKIKEFNDFVVGIKVRASGSVMGEDTLTPFLKAREISNITGKPIMVHFGNYPPSIEFILDRLDKNDVLTHCYHGKPNGILQDETIKNEVSLSRNKGIFFDVGHGQDSFSYTVAKLAKNNDFAPDSISSDLHKYNINGIVGSLSNVLTKFLSLEYSLENVIELVTSVPAKIMKLDHFGFIKENGVANLTFFDIIKENKIQIDSTGKIIEVTKVIKPKSCLINGEYLEADNDIFERQNF